MSSEQEKDVLREWRESAPYWAKHADTVRSLFAPITAGLIEAGGISNGHSVLDVAGGAGEPSITIAESVGASGSVICTDAVAEMVATARNEARRKGASNIGFAQCVGESLPFAANTFDAVVCRLGVMLFPDPASAIGEMLRVVRPAGLVSFAVWSRRESNPFFHIVMDVVSRYIESPPEDPDAPGAFRFAEPGKLARLVREAGAIDVTERLLNFELEAPITPRQFWEVRSELSDTLRAKVASLLPEQLARVAKDVEEAGRAFYRAGRMKFPGQVLIVTARKG
ncbi:MAG: class I SAM-dependent methyltransferase [Acidobacteriota bacterium]